MADESATNAILEQIKSAGKEELEALKPQIAALVRKYVEAYEEAHMTGIVGKIERHVVDEVVDGMFGPAPVA